MSKYQDIVTFINAEIENKHIKHGEKMPTIRDLSQKFNCSKQTVVHAYEILQKAHLVYSIPQSGYYLVDKKELYAHKEKKIIDLSAGSPDESILQYEEFQHCLNQAIDIYKATLFNYSSPKGLPQLIYTLKKHFEDYQIFCSSDDIYITSGSQQAINILCSMPFPNGKINVLVEQPTYHGTLKALETTNTSVIGIERKFNGIDFKELEKKFAYGNIKCFYTIPRFSNPLGLSYSNAEKRRIIKLAQKYDIYIIEDDYLGDLEIKDNSYPMYYTDVSDRVIYIKNFSKVLLPGLRIGAVILPKILRNTFQEYKKWMDLNTSVLSQGALDIYIKSGMFNANKNQIKKIYTDRMLTLKQTSSEIEIPQIKWHIPDIGFYGYIQFLDNLNIDWLVKECTKKDLIIKDISENYLKDYYNNDILRISVGSCKSSDVKNGIINVLKLIESYYN